MLKINLKAAVQDKIMYDQLKLICHEKLSCLQLRGCKNYDDLKYSLSAVPTANKEIC